MHTDGQLHVWLVPGVMHEATGPEIDPAGQGTVDGGRTEKRRGAGWCMHPSKRHGGSLAWKLALGPETGSRRHQ